MQKVKEPESLKQRDEAYIQLNKTKWNEVERLSLQRAKI
jgi:hypothetical protein